MTTRLVSFVCLAAVLSLLAGTAGATTLYTITNLGPVDGDKSYGNGLNELGHVAGESRLPGDDARATLWAGGAPIDLGVLTGGTESSAYGINNLGQVVGTSQAGSGWYPFLWEDGTMTNLCPLDIDWGGVAVAVNDASQVTGWWNMPLTVEHACIWEDGTLTDLGTLGGTMSFGRDINELGDVVGFAETADSSFHAFLWHDGTMTDLGTLGGKPSYAHGMNDMGLIVGESYTDGGDSHACAWDDGVISDLGTLGGNQSIANNVNNSGRIVGRAETDSYSQHAALWEDGGVVDLNDVILDGSAWVLIDAMDINDAGQITGYGWFQGEDRAFLLTPIPEPSVLLVVLLGLVGAAARAWKRR